MDEFIVKANLITSFVNVVIMIFIATREKQKQKSTDCAHEIIKTVVVQSAATCETTVVVCQICNKWLTKPKTDCI